jgi:malonyl-CoA/methylmalonyl-CoA synthetase
VLADADADLPAPLAALPRVPIPRESARSTARNLDLDMPPSAPALVIYTSGTTGPPKGAVLSRAALAANLDALADAWAWTAADVLVHALPLFHVHGLVLGVLGVLGALRRGGSMRHLGTFSASALAGAVDGGATLVFGVPTHYHRLAGELAADPVAAAAVGRARLLVSGSAALTAVDHARLQRLTGLAVRERYGLTETLILTAARADEPVEPGTVGRPLAGTEIRLVREDAGDDLGAVEVRGPGLFSGYLGGGFSPTTADGWFRTGDIGRWTASGSLALVGRKTTDLIKSGGFKIGAGEIENALLEHPARRRGGGAGRSGRRPRRARGGLRRHVGPDGRRGAGGLRRGPAGSAQAPPRGAFRRCPAAQRHGQGRQVPPAALTPALPASCAFVPGELRVSVRRVARFRTAGRACASVAPSRRERSS